MGIIIGKFRKKKSTYDILEKLEQEIVSIEEFGRSTEQTRKKIIGRFVLLAILVYVILAFALYIYYQRISTNQRLICVIPLIAFPLIIWVIKRFLTWYYSRKIKKNEKKLVSLKDEKKKILDNVMETETYKVAKKILDKFGNDMCVSTPVMNKPTAIVPSTARPFQTGLRQRNIGLHSTIRERLSIGGPQTSFRARQLTASPIIANRSVSGLTSVVPRMGPVPGTPLPLPRSILPRDRTILDKMVDYLVGDGPSNRYALICKRCNNHNGMSLKEEFEYLSFRCCYCSASNPARKKRPTGPKFETSPLRALPANTSDSDKNSASDSDAESTKAIVTEPNEDFPDIGKFSDTDKLCDSDFNDSGDTEKVLNITDADDNVMSPMDISKSIEEELVDKEEAQKISESENETRE
ncbi:endoplasmic reticulum junction formation protein lunapark-A [Anoplophora glabripennis]|uniref:endoplasmic reticulum junction formation protein lunapark-A n=1 Tax=Anoplophora glabripennis TaxID=217634 RepID=UPI0008751B30|nr:endoplasmic reticulum junction formation protein lunapark-A [Anoplophora glabripennis]XP_018575351.1 endoplasmic reticulum junction formation protein lunapark-A [Anoplophora glabripennis]